MGLTLDKLNSGKVRFIPSSIHTGKKYPGKFGNKTDKNNSFWSNLKNFSHASFHNSIQKESWGIPKIPGFQKSMVPCPVF